jgi:hypothetical protein
MRPGIRTLPLRVQPLPGEAFDSWLETSAVRHHATLGEIQRHLGFPSRSGSGDRVRSIPPDWTIALPAPEAAAVARASGLAPEKVMSMTLAHYDGRALHITADGLHVKRGRLWGRAGSRFCPDCLAASSGRWQLTWRLGWTFACPTHRCLLADCCPSCGRIQRLQPRSGKVVPRPGFCGNPPTRTDGPPSAGCGFDLTQTPTFRLPEGHPALLAQDRLLGIIDTGTASFGPYAAHPQPARTALNDIRAISGRVLAALPAHSLVDLSPPDLAERHLVPEPGCHLAHRATARPGYMSPARAVSTAVAVTLPLSVLAHRDIHRSGSAMRELLLAMHPDLHQVTANSIDSWGRGLSPVLKAVHLAALAPSFKPLEQLRFRTITALPSRPSTASRAGGQRARKIPSMFWPSWAVRFSSSPEGFHNVLPMALSTSLLMINSWLRLDAATELLGSHADGPAVGRILHKLGLDPHWPDIQTALIRLADYLDALDVPIDYARRRRLDYTCLLPHERWLKICRSTGTQPGNGRREWVVRRRLFQRISGLPAQASPGFDEDEEAHFRVEAARFPVFLTPELAKALSDEAHAFLLAQHVRNEPVVWQPPAHLLDGLDLPGPDPTSIDIPHLHCLIRQGKHPVRRTAQTLGTSIPVVRGLLEENPAPAAAMTEAAARSTGRVRHAARQRLPRSDFIRLYQRKHLSLARIAELTGISRRVLTSLAHEYGIPLRDGPQDYTRRGTIERDWLHEQYVVRCRTLTDLARERGMSRANMERWAHRHHIPIRTRGGASHNSALRLAEQAARTPAILRKALTSPYAWQRLERFAAAVHYPTLHEAARARGITPAALIKQIQRLEKDLGQQLLERAERGHPMKLTPFGHKVATATRETLAENMTRPGVTS